MSTVGRRVGMCDVGKVPSIWRKCRVLSPSLVGLFVLVGGHVLRPRAAIRSRPLAKGWQNIPAGHPTAMLLALSRPTPLGTNPRT